MNIPARMVPEIECQAHEMAHGTTANGLVAIKKFVAKLVAKPAFCIPTSMLMVRFFAVLNLNSVPVRKPSR